MTRRIIGLLFQFRPLFPEFTAGRMDYMTVPMIGLIFAGKQEEEAAASPSFFGGDGGVTRFARDSQAAKRRHARIP